jgi:hypothetical protein
MSPVTIDDNKALRCWRIRMRRFLSVIVVTLFFAGVQESVHADDITVSGNPGAIVVNTATAGLDLDPATDASTTYSIDVTTANKKITGSIDTSMPANTTLSVSLAAPAGATSNGWVSLDVTASDLVTGLVIGTNESGLSIIYRLSATVDAGVVPSSSKTVTFTIADSS